MNTFGVLMAHLHALSSLSRPPLLFLKATQKKRVFVPTFTRRNGVVVQGHYAMVHVSDAHDAHKILSGEGSHSQKAAHAKLVKKDWFQALPHDHQLPVLLEHATEIQDKASAGSVLSTLKKKVLAGQKPSNAEMNAFAAAPGDKQKALLGEFTAGGKGASFGALFHQHAASVPKVAEVPAVMQQEPAVTVVAAPVPVAPKVVGATQAAPPPAVPVQASTPEWSDEKGAIALHLDAIDNAKLPDSNTNAASANKKLQAIAAATAKGDVKSLLMMGYGSNNYGATAAKLANQSLALLGSTHQVSAGQKMASHPGMSGAPATPTVVPTSPTGESGKSGETGIPASPAPAGITTKLKLDGHSVEIAPVAGGKFSLSIDGTKEGEYASPGAAQAHAHEVVYESEPAALTPTVVPTPGVAAPAKDSAAVKKAKAIDPAKVSAWLAAVPGKADTSLFDGVSTKAKDKFLKWKQAVGKTHMPEYKAGYVNVAVSSLYGMTDQVLLNNGSFVAVTDILMHGGWGQVAPADPVAIQKAAIAALSGVSTPTVAAVPVAPVAAKPVTAGLPPIPLGIKQAQGVKAMKMAKLGDVAGLTNLHDKLVAPKTKAYVGELLAAIKKAQGVSAAGASVANWEFNSSDHGFSGAPTLYLKKEGVDHFIVKTPEGEYEVYGIGSGDQETAGDEPEIFGSKEDVQEYLSGALDVHVTKATLAKLDSGADASPKEGDTKQGADGALVFQNGRWHKQGDVLPVVPVAVSKAKVTQHVYTNTEEGHNKFWATAVQGSILRTTYGKIGTKGSETMKLFASEMQAYEAQAKLIKEKTAKGYKFQDSVSVEGFAPAQAAPVKVVGATAGSGFAIPPKPTPTVQVTPNAGPAAPVSIDAWKKTGEQGGYNEGGTYVDPQGVAWYCKFPAGGEKVAKNELLAGKLYELAGVDVAAVKLITQGGKVGLASKIVVGAAPSKAAMLAGTAPGLLSGFAADAWLANWDAVGNNPQKGYDNILIKPDGSAVRIDAGGALLYGGAGGKKQTFTDKVTDLKTMLDPAKNAHTSKVFGKMTPADIAASVAKVAAIDPSMIAAVVEMYGPGNGEERARMAAKLIARQADMLEQYPAAKKAAEKAQAKAPKPKVEKPDPTKLKVDASLLPPMHNFMNWNGSGKPISDKPYVAQNIIDEQAILAFALKGNLVALKAYKYQPVDKLTGQPLGEPKSMDQNPSQYVREFYDSCVSFLEVVANPAEPMRTYDSKDAHTVAQLASMFKPFDYGVSVASAPANQRLGFWIALGVASSPAKFKPKTVSLKFTEAAKQAAYTAYTLLPKTVKTFINAVQSSGSANQPYRDGKEVDQQGQNTRTVLADLYTHAVAHEAGTTVNKWINMPDSMVAQFIAEPEGLVFQNPGSMCTSQHTSKTANFGKHRVIIHYADGASAIDTFGSGDHHGEAEITTLPGARYMVLSRKMVADAEHSNPGAQRLELEVLMLPPDATYIANIPKKPT
jgi:predicted DNA-binding WGR domain protein